MSGFNFYDLIKRRRSIRNYDPEKKIPKEVLGRILEAGRLAPTSSNRQPAKFRVILSEKKLKEIAMSYEREWFGNAPAVIVVTGKRSDAWTRRYDGFNSLELDVAIMMDHMILAAEFEGVSSCWIIAFKEEIVKKALDLDDDESVFCMTPLGYPKDNFVRPKMPERKPLSELVEYY